jgi:Predicted transcriptional regulators
MELYEELKEYRKLAQLTQQQMADKLGVDKSTYAHYESGRRTPDAKKYLQIAKILGIPSLPIRARVIYSDGLLDQLENVIQKYGSPSSDFHENKIRFDEISKVLNKAINERNEIMSVDGLPLNDLPSGTTFMTVNLDLRGEQLINKAIQCTHNIITNYFPKREDS